MLPSNGSIAYPAKLASVTQTQQPQCRARRGATSDRNDRDHEHGATAADLDATAGWMLLLAGCYCWLDATAG
jgi:hypothetical protein